MVFEQVGPGERFLALRASSYLLNTLIVKDVPVRQGRNCVLYVTGSWPPAGPPPGQQPPPGSAPFVGPPATQVYTSPQGQSPAVAPAYQWSSPPGQVPPGSGQPPQGVAVGQTPQGTYGAYVPVSAAPQQTPTMAPPIRPYGEFAASKSKLIFVTFSLKHH